MNTKAEFSRRQGSKRQLIKQEPTEKELDNFIINIKYLKIPKQGIFGSIRNKTFNGIDDIKLLVAYKYVNESFIKNREEKSQLLTEEHKKKSELSLLELNEKNKKIDETIDLLNTYNITLKDYDNYKDSINDVVNKFLIIYYSNENIKQYYDRLKLEIRRIYTNYKTEIPGLPLIDELSQDPSPPLPPPDPSPSPSSPSSPSSPPLLEIQSDTTKRLQKQDPDISKIFIRNIILMPHNRATNVISLLLNGISESIVEQFNDKLNIITTEHIINDSFTTLKTSYESSLQNLSKNISELLKLTNNI